MRTSALLLVAGQRTGDTRTAEKGRVRVGQEAAVQLQVQVGACVPALLVTRLDEVANVAPALRSLIGEKAEQPPPCSCSVLARRFEF